MGRADIITNNCINFAMNLSITFQQMSECSPDFNYLSGRNGVILLKKAILFPGFLNALPLF